uniref:Uncharacterized protein n=1 Tax=Kwoniella dejecticola CBS 10117 TaxID=1296121 RepID=A0A1A6A296_9TREE|nr:uncharacterized protein I303_05021 [Kwoniella dejecticola CBS 10117]OBR84164.1 hypothetical protein I303_05021 [Kwoniella dejecticola CBS 10117]
MTEQQENAQDPLEAKADTISETSSHSQQDELRDAWDITKGGILSHKGIFYEVKRVPNTLSD